MFVMSWFLMPSNTCFMLLLLDGCLLLFLGPFRCSIFIFVVGRTRHHWPKKKIQNTTHQIIFAEISTIKNLENHGIPQMKIKETVSMSTTKHSYYISIRSIRFLRVLTTHNFCSLGRLLRQALLPRICQYYQRKQLAQESVLRRKEEQGSSQSMIRVQAIQISYCMFVLSKEKGFRCCALFDYL
jgi:hypothetical protein